MIAIPRLDGLQPLIGMGHVQTVQLLFQHQWLIPVVQKIACKYEIDPDPKKQYIAWRTVHMRNCNAAWKHIPRDFISGLITNIILIPKTANMPPDGSGAHFIAEQPNRQMRYTYYRISKGVLWRLEQPTDIDPTWETKAPELTVHDHIEQPRWAFHRIK